MSHITSPTPYSIGRPQDVIDIVNKHSAVNTSVGVIFIALGGILIDAYQAAMVGFGNKYIALQFGISPGLAATVNASVLVAALIGGLLANRVINRFGQKRAFIIGMGLCTIGAAAVAIAPNIWWVLVCRVIMGFGLGIDFPLATNAVAELRGSTSKKTGSSVNLWQMAWYVSTTVVYLVLLPLLLSGIAEEQLWRYGIFIGAIFAVIIMILRYFFIGESAMWAARVGRYDKACDILANAMVFMLALLPSQKAMIFLLKKQKVSFMAGMGFYLTHVIANVLFSAALWRRCKPGNITPWVFIYL